MFNLDLGSGSEVGKGHWCKETSDHKVDYTQVALNNSGHLFYLNLEFFLAGLHE